MIVQHKHSRWEALSNNFFISAKPRNVSVFLSEKILKAKSPTIFVKLPQKYTHSKCYMGKLKGLYKSMLCTSSLYYQKKRTYMCWPSKAVRKQLCTLCFFCMVKTTRFSERKKFLSIVTKKLRVIKTMQQESNQSNLSKRTILFWLD